MRALSLLIFFFLSNFLVAQEIPPDLLDKMKQSAREKTPARQTSEMNATVINKGSVLFSNGNSVNIRNLRFQNDSVSFTDSLRVKHKYPLDEISRVTKFRSKTLEGAGIGLFCGTVGGYFIGILAYPENNFLETLLLLIINDEDEKSPRISKKAVPIVIGGSLLGAGIGALAGSSSHKEKIVYQNDLSVRFYPEWMNFAGNRQAFMVTCKISLH